MSREEGIREMESVVLRAIDRAERAGARQVDAVLARSDEREVRVRGDEIEFVKQARERGLGIRALVEGKDGLRTAIVSTSDLDADAVDRMAEEAVALARETAPDPAAGLPEEGFADPIPDLALFDPEDLAVPLEARIEDARRAERAAREADPRIDNSEGSQASSGFARILYANSRGFLASYESASHGLFAEPLAREGDSMQRDYWMTTGRRLADLEDPVSVGRKAAERALRRLGARRVPTCEVPVLFDGITAPSLIGQLASCLSGYAIYRESSFLADRLGDTIASERVTLIDDGRLPGGLGSRPFDGEGLATRRNVLIDRGRLQTWLLDCYSARKLGMKSTGNASRGVGSGPHVGTTNLWLEPGEGSLEELIGEIDRGLLVTELIGMGFNPTTGDYSRGAAGLWIEKGEIVHPVEEITIAGNLGDMLEKIDRVGGELEWRGRTASPPIRIARMTVAGE
ncbi:MAG TPA: TldD/PmbA family protein [Deltaproteobacteria bacterium]|nr:TldD/PmbA family protein [Deltaproteobacteria bacterium]